MNLRVSTLLAILTTLFAFSTTQQGALYFPNEESENLQVANRDELSQSGPAKPTRVGVPTGTSDYENYVDKIIANSISKLTLAIDKLLLQQSSNNIVFAPISIAGALALILLGSNGKTFKEIIDVMGLTTGVTDIEHRSQVVHEQFSRMIANLESTSGFQIGSQVVFGSAIFVQNNYSIRSLYKQTAEALYNSEILNVDFQSNPGKAQKIINAWVSDRTKGKINDILDEPPSVLTKVIIATAMYFKAEWEYPFFEGTTQKRPFYGNGRRSPSTSLVDMMSNGGYFPYFKDSVLGCEIMGFPYKGNRSTMYVVMPSESDPNRLKQLEEKLSSADFERLVSSTVYTSSVVLFPKMRIESTTDLRDALQALGVKSLFNPAEANLALLSPGKDGVSPAQYAEENPLSASSNAAKEEGLLIFSRNGEKKDCAQVFDASSNVTTCQEVVEDGSKKPATVTYKKIGNKIGRKISTRIASRNVGNNGNTLDNVRQLINQQDSSNNYQNPGLYADKIIHKVYMDITETGTEAAASTSVSLSRDGGRVTFRVDAPFFFFIWHEETKAVLFWGSVNVPTPNYRN